MAMKGGALGHEPWGSDNGFRSRGTVNFCAAGGAAVLIRLATPRPLTLQPRGHALDGVRLLLCHPVGALVT